MTKNVFRHQILLLIRWQIVLITNVGLEGAIQRFLHSTKNKSIATAIATNSRQFRVSWSMFKALRNIDATFRPSQDDMLQLWLLNVVLHKQSESHLDGVLSTVNYKSLLVTKKTKYLIVRFTCQAFQKILSTLFFCRFTPKTTLKFEKQAFWDGLTFLWIEFQQLAFVNIFLSERWSDH